MGVGGWRRRWSGAPDRWRRLAVQPIEQRVGRRQGLGRGARHAGVARLRRERRGVRRATMRRTASVPSGRCSTLPQRSTLRNTGPNSVADACSQSRSACTGQPPGRSPRGTTRTRGGRSVRSSPGRVSSSPLRGEAELLDLEADQRRAAQSGTPQAGAGQQQQGAVAQPGEVARAGRGHPRQLGRPRRWRATGRGGAAGVAQQRGDRRIAGRRDQPVLAVAVGDRGGAAGQRAGAQAGHAGGEKARHGGGIGGQRGQPLGVAPGGEGAPVGAVEPQRLGRRRAAPWRIARRRAATRAAGCDRRSQAAARSCGRSPLPSPVPSGSAPAAAPVSPRLRPIARPSLPARGK